MKDYTIHTTTIQTQKLLMFAASFEEKLILFVPIVLCHRVIANNWNIGSYTRGVWIKEYLLNLEKGKKWT